MRINTPVTDREVQLNDDSMIVSKTDLKGRITYINRDFIEALNTEDVKAALEKQGLAIRTGTPAQLGSLIKSDMARWQKVVTDSQIEAD